MVKKRKRRQSDIDATKRYDAKTYKKFNIVFRIEDDAEIIEAIEAAHDNGIPTRELINGWYKAHKKSSI